MVIRYFLDFCLCVVIKAVDYGMDLVRKITDPSLT